jgi:hypothetical protein
VGGDKEAVDLTPGGLHAEVLAALAEKVAVESVQDSSNGLVVINLRLDGRLRERDRLATQEWVQLQLWMLEGRRNGDGLVFVAHYL